VISQGVDLKIEESEKLLKMGTGTARKPSFRNKCQAKLFYKNYPSTLLLFI
jgi:hypothetical protein